MQSNYKRICNPIIRAIITHPTPLILSKVRVKGLDQPKFNNAKIIQEKLYFVKIIKNLFNYYNKLEICFNDK